MEPSVQAIYDKVLAFHTREVERVLAYDRVKIIWGSDDMGFKTGPMIGVDHLRQWHAGYRGGPGPDQVREGRPDVCGGS